MKKFMVLYMVPTASMDAMMNSTPEERQAGMDSWKAWMSSHQADFADMGSPLGRNTRVTKDGATETRNEMTGYSIIQAESSEDAVKIVQSSPNFDMAGGYIEVMEVVGM